jgi:ParB family chromosome partitioning protein
MKVRLGPWCPAAIPAVRSARPQWALKGGGVNDARRVVDLRVDQLMPDPTQPRKNFLSDEIERLATSIKARGVLQPLRVTVFDQASQTFLIVTGESRWRAARLAGLVHVPCLVLQGQPDEADLLIDRIVENECRHDLRPMELARSLAKLKVLKKCTAQELAAELGISGASITRSEALLTLPDAIQAMVDENRVPESAAYEISRLDDEVAQLELAHAVASKRMTRDQAAQAVRSKVGKTVRPRASRLACQLDGGVCVTVSAAQALTWDDFNAAIEQIRKAAKKLCDGGKEVTELARTLRAS